MGRFPLSGFTPCFWQFSAALGLISLTGCGSGITPPPAVEIRTQRVEVPVSVACVDKAAIPAEPEKIAGKLTGDARRDLDTVSASALRLRSWGREMRAMLVGCTTP